jgi:hypothetical protein
MPSPKFSFLPRRLLVIVCAILFALAAPDALACTDCASLNYITSCLQITYGCFQGEAGDYCAADTNYTAPAGTPCASDGNPCTADVCDGAGTCVHGPPQGMICGNACVTTGCCASPNTCTGGKVCPSPGAVCACPQGTRECGGTCIANDKCCANSDCAGPESGPGIGLCSGVGGSCSVHCDSGYKPCGKLCVPATSCCSNADCGGGTTCSGSGGSCTCPNGSIECGPAPTCANGSPPNDGGVCPSEGCSDGGACGSESCVCHPDLGASGHDAGLVVIPPQHRGCQIGRDGDVTGPAAIGLVLLAFAAFRSRQRRRVG